MKYWKTEDPSQTTGARVISLIRHFHFPTEGEEGRAFSDWWQDLPGNTIDEIADADPVLAFEVMAHVKDPLVALGTYNRATSRKAQLEREAIEGEASDLRKQLKACAKELEAAHLEILRLKAEIYDIMRERR